MGIKELLQFISPLCETSIDQFNSHGIKKIAVDISCWLHKVKYSNNCALAIDKNSCEWKYCLFNIFKFICSRFDVIFVFDGKTPEFKQKEHEKRRIDFTETRNQAMKLMKQSESMESSELKEKLKQKALYMLVKTIEVSDIVAGAKEVITDWLNSEFCVADYEADQKLAQLSTTGQVDLIITEDSDLIVYGCPLIMYKFKNNSGMLYSKEEYMKTYVFESWKLFQKFCILCGCDYYKFDGIGSKKAKKICMNEKSYELWAKNIPKDEINKIDNILNIFLLQS